MTESSMIASLKSIFRNTAFPLTEEWEKTWASVAVIFRANENSALELLLIERAKHPSDAWSGHMAFPGGRRDNDESILETAIRETKEEVGIDLSSNTDFWGYLPPVRAFKHGEPQNFSLIPTGFYLKSSQNLHLDSTEVAEAKWFDLDWLFNQANHSRFQYNHRDGNILLPCIPLENNRIWGLTYRIIDHLQSRLIR